MVQKISNITTEMTEEQENQLWAEVLSHRNKLLANSDWTQLPDSGLTPESVSRWNSWRKSLKAINRRNYGHRDSAEMAIASLSRKMPFNSYATDSVAGSGTQQLSLQDYRNSVIKYLDAEFNKLLQCSFLDNPILVEEQFKEAVDFLKDEDETRPYPLISVSAEIYGVSYKTVAAEFIARKVEVTKRMVSLKRQYFLFYGLVHAADTDVQLTDVQSEIKQWISTST